MNGIFTEAQFTYGSGRHQPGSRTGLSRPAIGVYCIGPQLNSLWSKRVIHARMMGYGDLILFMISAVLCPLRMHSLGRIGG